jgi:Rad3-related DNA helicase
MIYENISVKKLIEFILSSGDIDHRSVHHLSAKEGILAHQYIQKQYAQTAQTEVPVSYQNQFDEINLTISGRIDGLLTDNHGNIIINEIKSTVKSLDEISQPSEIHIMQAKVYAFMYAKKSDLKQIMIQVTYINISSMKAKDFIYDLKIEDIDSEITDIIHSYLYYLRKLINIKLKRNSSIDTLNFPHTYRRGQRAIIKNIYKCLLEEKNLFLHAPTGSGKTLSALFPSLKYILLKDEKIFYLVSKGTQKKVVLETLELLKTHGLFIKAVIIDAKEKVCCNESEITNCNPEKCKFTIEYYNKIKEILLEILHNEDIITREVIKKYAQKYMVCPFELSLDISCFCDIIICDYNYIFDPFSSLKRYFEENNKYLFLIDEAHNLSDRGRQMYSAEISKNELLTVRKTNKQYKSFYNALTKLNTSLNKINKSSEDNIVELSADDLVFLQINNFLIKAEKYIQLNGELPATIQDFYLILFKFNKLFQIASSYHIFYYDRTEKKLKLFCLDASKYLLDTISKSSSSIFFSATLMPIDYFMRISGGSPTDYTMISKSPFISDKLKVTAICHVDLTYKKRNQSINEIIQYLHTILNRNKGNYMIFFPSFEFMNFVYENYKKKYGDENILLQKTNMSETDRDEFISYFNNKESNIAAFVVLGGSFSESIDLVGDRLIGCVIISVGLPKLCYEREKLKQYYDKEGHGFEFAYLYESVNKIMQAGGRVIRSENDTGFIYLIDKRFSYTQYKSLLSQTWENIDYIFNYNNF